MIIKFLNFPNFIDIPTGGLSEGLKLLWLSSNNFSFQLIWSNHQFIHSRTNDMLKVFLDYVRMFMVIPNNIYKNIFWNKLPIYPLLKINLG